MGPIGGTFLLFYAHPGTILVPSKSAIAEEAYRECAVLILQKTFHYRDFMIEIYATDSQ